ncbi:polysaccharide biosynthesis/export family protein [Sphingomonas humi]
MLLGGCAATGLSTAVGPSRKAIVNEASAANIEGLQLIPLNSGVVEALRVSDLPAESFAQTIGSATPIGTVVGVGDVVEVTIWEAPPALLFGGGMISTKIGQDIGTSRPGTIPETLVGPSGTITVPFAGQVPAAGRSLSSIEQSIVSRLRGKANQPQVIVRIVRNATANVSVLGEVSNSGRIPLTPKGERLLDILAAAGGTRQPADRITLQLSRGNVTATMPLAEVIRNPAQNIILQRDDVLTAIYQPFTLTVLGAAGKNEEIRFEGTGLTLAQALGRIGGLQDMRADPRGVFIFRYETAEQMRALGRTVPPTLTRVPVVYQVDLKDPQTYFAAQKFAMKNSDVIYISNSPAADFQRFVNILASSVLPGVSVVNSVR